MGHDSPSLDTASICDLDQHAMDQEPRTMQEPRTRRQGPCKKSHCKDPAGTNDQEPWTRGQGNIIDYTIQYKLALYM